MYGHDCGHVRTERYPREVSYYSALFYLTVTICPGMAAVADVGPIPSTECRSSHP